MNGLRALAVCAAVGLLLSGCGEGQGRSTARRSPRRPVAAETEAPPAAMPGAEMSSVRSSLAAGAPAEFNTEAYDHVEDNAWVVARREPLSTFAVDVDTASYANVRRMLNAGQWPPPGAVRIEEMVNYFTYDYSPPEGDVPFSVQVDVAACPWNADHRLARIGLKGRTIDLYDRPASNLVFLIDVSGSMQSPNKLPLVKQALGMLTDALDQRDRIAIVVYAGASGLVLPPTQADQKEIIRSVLDNLEPGGGTHGSAGIQLAYDTAARNFLTGGTNRVILCTDGDFNVGITDQSQLVRLIEQQARRGVFLSVLGFGMGNYKDSTMEKLADKGNGNYAYIDTMSEARKVLIEEMSGTLLTIAKDVKIQVDFNPAQVAGYRLVGYENRMLRAEDFKDDTKDAGEIGAGHTVTALYEIIPAGQPVPGSDVDPSKYQQLPAEAAPANDTAASDELLTVRLRYKQPDGETSQALEVPATDDGRPLAEAPVDFRFAAAVAQFGLLLRDSPHKQQASYDNVLQLARTALGPDPNGYRAEFLTLVHKARAMK